MQQWNVQITLFLTDIREESSDCSPQSERMVNHARSTRTSKNDESTSSTKKAIKSKGSSTSGSPTTDSSGLRRSTRGTPSRKQMGSSPSTTKKSERLEKRTPTITPVKRKSEIVEKQKVSIPLRRSDRGEKHLLSSSSGSKKSEKGSDSSDIKRKKLKREKSMKQLTLESREITGRGKQDPKPVGVKKKRMDARTYVSFFKKQLRRDTAPGSSVLLLCLLCPLLLLEFCSTLLLLMLYIIFPWEGNYSCVI